MEHKLSSRHARRMVMDISSTFACSLAVSLLRLGRAEQQQLRTAMQKACAEQEKQANDPTHIPRDVGSLRIFQELSLIHI